MSEIMSGAPTPVLPAKIPLGIRFQEPLFLLIYLAGFLAPWERSGAHATLWLALSTLAARTGWLAVANATTAVTVVALACLVLGTIVRVGGASCLSPAVMRRRLYLGGWLVALGTSILMPPSGAIVFLLLFSLLSLFLAFTETRFLSTSGGTVAAGHTPRWWKAVLAETYPIAFTTCFAIFAWRYNTTLLIKCLLICYGVSLLVRALSNPLH